jgi:hypothetical protein
MFVTLHFKTTQHFKTMKNLLVILISGGFLFSCIKHVVIPPPLPQVDLSATFVADTNGTQFGYATDVNGFYVQATNYREILSSPQPSNIKYFSAILSTNFTDLFKVSIGRDYWDAVNGPFPPVNQFRVYFESMRNVSLPFSDDANSGVMLEWRDANNQLWKTSASSPLPQSFVFTSVVQESDEEGDYVRFTANFSATFYSPDMSQQRTLNNGQYVGYFKNN